MFAVPTTIPNIKKKELEFIKLKQKLNDSFDSASMRQKFVRMLGDNQCIMDLCIMKQNEFEQVYIECINYSKKYIDYINKDLAVEFYNLLHKVYHLYTQNRINHRVSL